MTTTKEGIPDYLTITLPSGVKARFDRINQKYFLYGQSDTFPTGAPVSSLTVTDAVWLLRITKPITSLDKLYEVIFTNEPMLLLFNEVAKDKGLSVFTYIESFKADDLKAEITCACEYLHNKPNNSI